MPDNKFAIKSAAEIDAMPRDELIQYLQTEVADNPDLQFAYRFKMIDMLGQPKSEHMRLLEFFIKRQEQDKYMPDYTVEAYKMFKGRAGLNSSVIRKSTQGDEDG